MQTCEVCGKSFEQGDEFITLEEFNFTKHEVAFCSRQCLKEYLLDNIDDVVDKIAEQDGDVCCVESDDPYELYGVSRSDFI